MTGVFEGVGTLQFTPDNKYAYAYSGDVTSTTTESAGTTILRFTNSSEYLVAQVCLFTDDVSNGNKFVDIQFNGVSVWKGLFDNEPAEQNQPFPLIIPPFTDFHFLYGDGNGGNITVVVTAKVKGAIEQENLESITDNNKWASK